MSSTKRKKLKIDTLPKSKENTNVEDSIGSIFDNSHYLSHVLAYDDSQIDTFIYPNSSKKTEAKLIHSVIDIRSKYNYCDDHKVRVLVGKSLESPNILVIIFRGTDNICKETDDLKIPQTFITIKKYKAFKDAKVHEGFMNLYRSIRHELRMTVLDMLTKDKNLKSIFVTGHSLGGALANLCAIDMDFYYNNGDGKTIVPEGIEFNLVTFGSPRVGDVEFAFYVNNMPKMKRNIRVIYEDDIVAQIPVTNKFVHTGTAIRIKNELLVAEEFNFDETLRLEIAKDIFNPEGLSSYAANLINLIDCSISSLNAMTMISSSYDKIKSFAYDAVKLASISLYSNEKNEVKSKLNLMGQYHSAYKSKINTSQMKNIRKLYDDILAKRNSKKIKRRHNK